MRILLSILLLGFTGNLLAQDAFIKEFQQKWKNASEYTIELAEMMPEEKYDFKPADGSRTFEEQVLHMMSNMVWLSSSYLAEGSFERDLKKKDYSKAEIIALLKETTTFAAHTIAALSAEDLEKRVDFFAGPMSKRQIMMLMNDHLTHHRGQAIVYLRMNGIKPPRYRGW
jgi:uncharacterized damage-inducible protein DinB